MVNKISRFKIWTQQVPHKKKRQIQHQIFVQIQTNLLFSGWKRLKCDGLDQLNLKHDTM
jgi:hypothetical protein